MGGFFGVASKESCTFDLFFGTDYHSHLGTRRAGMAVYGENGFSKAIHKIIGPPLMDSFQTYYGFSYEKAKEGVDYYREYYQDRGIYENEVYPGIPKLLEKLQREGKKIVLATSKPEHFAKMILEHFQLTKYFTRRL